MHAALVHRAPQAPLRAQVPRVHYAVAAYNATITPPRFEVKFQAEQTLSANAGRRRRNVVAYKAVVGKQAQPEKK